MSIAKRKPGLFNGNLIIDRISINYSNLQKKYREWAAEFKDYREATCWLKKNRIPVKKSKYQKEKFDLLSKDWNPITIPVLNKKAEHIMHDLKIDFDTLSRNFSKDDLAWYQVYFIHPVFHELYYYNEHYPDGYNARLPMLLRLPGIGLKSVKTYLKNEGNTIHDTFIHDCSTAMFKFIHIHPTVSINKNQKLHNLERNIRQLKTGRGLLSSDELTISMALSTQAIINFKTWIEYAPCAINEGPIFILKKGKSNLDCFREIVRILQSDNPTQNAIRGTLKKYYEIEE